METYTCLLTVLNVNNVSAKHHRQCVYIVNAKNGDNAVVQAVDHARTKYTEQEVDHWEGHRLLILRPGFEGVAYLDSFFSDGTPRSIAKEAKNIIEVDLKKFRMVLDALDDYEYYEKRKLSEEKETDKEKFMRLVKEHKSRS